jgi:hypothetical protein
MRPTRRIRILVTRYSALRWTARSLEHDIVIEERSADAALRTICEILCAHIGFDRRHRRPPLAAFPPAPLRVWDAFAHATPVEPTAFEMRGDIHERVGFEVSMAMCDPRAPAHHSDPRHGAGSDKNHPIEAH